MKKSIPTIPLAVLAILAAVLVASPARAHCDSLDGPVVNAAQRALNENNVNLVLVWVQKTGEAEIKRAFEQTRAVRKLSPAARELADRYFFETLVRVHRAGEGAPYTGLKPAGRNLGPAIPAGDQALESGKIEAVATLLTDDVRRGLGEHFHAARAKRGYDKDDVEAGRAFVQAYVQYIHFVERVHLATATAAHGHFAEPETAAPAAHGH